MKKFPLNRINDGICDHCNGADESEHWDNPQATISDLQSNPILFPLHILHLPQLIGLW